MNKPIAVVTGGAGFIGSHMVDLLISKGWQVRVIDNLSNGKEKNLSRHTGNSDVSLEVLDVCTLAPSSTLFREVTAVFHFAGVGDIVPSIEKPSYYMHHNVQGTVSVLECARFAKVKRFIYAASSSCYGLAAVPTREDHPIDPQYPYALSKYQGEQAVFHWHRVYRLPVQSIRIFNAYGPRSRTSGAYGAVFGVFLKQKLEGKPFTLVGDGSQRRDFVYVTDVAKAFYAAAQSSLTGQIYNLGAGNPQSISKLIALLKGEVVHLPKRPGEPDCTWADITKIERDLHWSPHISFETGVKKMVECIHDWKEAPLWDSRSIDKATQSWFSALTTA